MDWGRFWTLVVQAGIVLFILVIAVMVISALVIELWGRNSRN